MRRNRPSDREKAEHAVIATMPMFPIEACNKRLSWVGLNASMFDLVTTCDHSFRPVNPTRSITRRSSRISTSNRIER